VLDAETKPVERLKVGMYQRYWGGNADEGWTRLCLEQHCFPYDTLMDEDILEGDLSEYGAIILPHDPPVLITGGEELQEWWKENRPEYPLPEYPPEYQSGIGDEGKEKLKQWVEQGGTLVCLGEAGMYAIETLGLKAADTLKDLKPKDFHCPGSTVHMLVDTYNPAAYGMEEDALALFWGSPAYKILPSGDNHRYQVVASYPDTDILESGWLIGEEHLANKVAILRAEVGDGAAVLLGPRVQHRCQTHGTFKLLFNSLLG
jgi:hypothetical protein